ncbi:MAG: hypothetical protein ACKO2G_03550 [Verrucomicrobiales bacterium]
MGTVAPSGLEKPRSSGRATAVRRLVLIGAGLALLGTIESGRVGSVIPAMDDHLLVSMQKFLPPGRKGPLVLESRPDKDTRVFAPAPDDSPLPVPLCRYEKADQSILVEWPPGPVDLAMAIETMGAAKSLALAWAPDWEAPAEGTLALRAFANARSQAKDLPFLHAYWPGFTAAADENALALLALPPVIPSSNVRGEVANIPEVNDPGPWPPEAAGLPPADAGFGRLLLLAPLDAPPARVALPMLVRSGERILPSLSLLAFTRANRIEISSVDVRLGGAILAGKTTIPVDERGCLLLPTSFANRVPVISPLAEDAHAVVREKCVVIAHEGLASQSGASGDVGMWTAAALGAMEADDFALPIRILRRAPTAATIGVMALLILGSVASLWFPRRQRWWVAVALFAALALYARYAAQAHGQFIGLSLPLFIWLATTLLAMLFSPPIATKPLVLPSAERPSATPPEAPAVSTVVETSPLPEPLPAPTSEQELNLADPRRPVDPTRTKPKSGKRRRKG